MAEGLTDDEKYQQGWHDALEKQGEQKSVNDTDENIVEVVKNTSVLDMIESKDYSSIDPHFFKPADKVEPKFKVGNWITNGHCKCQITFIDSRYWYSETCVLGNVIDIDKTFHLWTIQDAKDGDVLATDDGSICVFDSTVEDGKYPFAYCGLTRRRFESYDRRLPFTHNNIHPATKEQRDLLFQKMHEAGYEWNSKTKELKKINSYCQEHCKGYQETGQCYADGECEAKRKTEQNLNIDEGKAEMDYCFTKMMAGEKVTPVWSETDESIVESILYWLKSVLNKGSYPRYEHWLNSIKQRYCWTPSYEQMEALWCAAEKYLESDNDNVVKLRGKVLESLYNELKNLNRE